MILSEKLRHQQSCLFTLACIAGVLVLAFLDRLSGPSLSLAVLYIFPVVWAAWSGGTGVGFLVALAAAMAPTVTEWTNEESRSNPSVVVGNMVMQLGIFTLIGFFVARAGSAYRELLRATQAQKAALEAEEEDHQRTRRAFHGQKELLESILTSMCEGVVVADKDGKLLFANEVGKQMCGIDPTDPAAPDWATLFERYRPDGTTPYPAEELPLFRAIQGEAVDSVEMILRRAGNPAPAWWTISARPLNDEQGNLRGGVVVFRDITARRLMEQEILEISSREQLRIGQELHDSLCQNLSGIECLLKAEEQKLPPTSAALATALKEIRQLIRNTEENARGLARRLYAPELQSKGLPAALDDLAVTLKKSFRIDCRVQCDDDIRLEDRAAMSALYRIAQEAASNAIRHGKAAKIDLSLAREGDRIVLKVMDDGIGFHPVKGNPKGMGLSVMGHRAALIGATLNVRRRDPTGTVVTCFLYCHQAGPGGLPAGRAASNDPRTSAHG